MKRVGDKVRLVGKIISINEKSRICVVLIDDEKSYNLVKIGIDKLDIEDEDDLK